MIPINATYAPIQAFVDELARCGVRHAVTCPGSRNAPIALTLAAEEHIRAWSVLDERSAAFFALGIAKATGLPVALTCTSGTAAANFFPAVVEAGEARVPLLVLTADRPPELREVGAGQSIDQVKLYGSAVRWFVEVGNHDPGRETALHHRALACRAYATALGPRPGPVHLNFGLREPLAPVAEGLEAELWQGRPDGRPWVAVDRSEARASAESVARAGREVGEARRGAIVCGPGLRPEVPQAVVRLAAAAGWPVLAEPTSGLRSGGHDRSHVVAHYDVLLRHASFADAHLPDLVVRFGDTPTSKPLRAWLSRTRQITVDAYAAWHEPTRGAERVIVADAESFALDLAQERAQVGPPPPSDGWLASWRTADAVAPGALAEAANPFEPKLFASLADVLPDGSTVWLSSSMPVRDVESFFPQGPRRLRFLANRGANGIDGVVSSAAGAAAAGDGRCVLLIGELALLHDLGGLIAARRHGIELTVVCANNGGGGIFDFLPVASEADPAAYEEHLATPHEVDLADVAALAGLPRSLASTPEELRAVADRPGLIELRTDRRENVRRHREVFERVGRALDGRDAPDGH